MPFDFKYQSGWAVDPGTGLTVCQPRIVPTSPPANPDDIEYQYALHQGDDRYYLGLFGKDAVLEKDGHRERVSTLDLGRDWVLDSVFGIKRDLGNGDDDFVFLQGLARGLVAVFERRRYNDDDERYVAVTNTALLTVRGVTVPDGVARWNSGEVVLAEIFVPAQTSVAIS